MEGLGQDSKSHYAWWSYLERGHGRVSAIPAYGVELGRVVEFMVQFRVSFASVHHFLEGRERKGQQKMNGNENEKPKVEAGGRRGMERAGPSNWLKGTERCQLREKCSTVSPWVQYESTSG